jgi:hypothetical protein
LDGWTKDNTINIAFFSLENVEKEQREKLSPTG